MAHHGYAGVENAPHSVQYLNASLKLQGVAAALFHYPYGVSHSIAAIGLIASKRHVAHNESPLYCICHRTGMIYHLLYGYRKCGGVAGHHVRRRVANENSVYPGSVHDACRRKIIGCEH